MKPSWNDAPEWAQYLAMDEDGVWYWYECEPKAGSLSFIPDYMSESEHAPVPNWQDSLESRPEPEASK